jgi:hypothetical protein
MRMRVRGGGLRSFQLCYVARLVLKILGMFTSIIIISNRTYHLFYVYS